MKYQYGLQTEQKSSKHMNPINPSRKKFKKSDNKDLDEVVFTWFKNMRSNNIPVNGNVFKEEALSLAKSLKLIDV